MNTAELKRFCTAVRRDIINMTANAGSGHPGGSLSAVELMSAIFCTKMRINPKNPQDPGRDRFVLSKGHAAPCYYGVLAELGYFDKSAFESFRQLHGMLQGHPDMKKIPGVDASTGSLGQGVSIAAGMALAAKHQGQDVKVYTILGDGECQEGQVWEAAETASKYQLDNLILLVDHNGLQNDGTCQDIMPPRDLAEKFRAFGFQTYQIDGHSIPAILDVFERIRAHQGGQPYAVIAKTVKGRGVSFMENVVAWHGQAPNEQEYLQAIQEIEEGLS